MWMQSCIVGDEKELRVRLSFPWNFNQSSQTSAWFRGLLIIASIDLSKKQLKTAVELCF